MAGKSYELLIFDFDGTLVDTAPDIAFYVNVVLEQFGFSPRPLPQVKKAIGRGIHELLKELAPGFADRPAELEKAVALFKQKYSGNPVVATDAYPGVREALSGPLRTLKKAIATNKPHEITIAILERLQLGAFFDSVIGENKGFPRKPDPALVLHILKSLGVEPDAAVLIGDSEIDCQTAKNAGIDFAWVDYGYDRPRNPAAHRRFSNASQWTELLL